MKHAIVHKRAEMFYGWPANNGVWAWGNEIAVGFTEAHYLESYTRHSQDESKPRRSVMARSLDGGETWTIERPGNYPEGFAFGKADQPDVVESALPRPLDFMNPYLAIRCHNGQFRTSHDRGRNWSGPYWFPSFGLTDSFTARTDYIALSSGACLLFISRNAAGVQGGPFSDRAFCVRTDDGGLTFSMQGYMLPEEPKVRSVMPSTVRIDDHTLVSALRRRFDHAEGSSASYRECWIDAAISEDLGKTWRFLSRIADTHSRDSQHNGNPPSLVRLQDGRLCVVYGYRAPEFGMRAKVSEDNGQSWCDEIILRNDARTWDIGYPRSVIRPDGKILSIYYYTTEQNREQHIAATIWDPDE